MPASENIAIARRIHQLEKMVTDTELVYVQTVIRVVTRGDEPLPTTKEQVYELAGKEPRPKVVREIPDLELLIDPVNQTRKLRSKLTPGAQIEFDKMKEDPNTRKIIVPIYAHEKQLAAILSKSPIVAVFGGNRAGKTLAIVWWLFRRWMLRGGKGKLFWWVSPTKEKAITVGAWTLCGPEALGGGVWPEALWTMTGKLTKHTQSPTMTMIDGSIVAFQHAALRGEQAGANLKSANVTDAVIDEVAVIDEENYNQVLARLSQQGGRLATATTKVKYHWTSQAFEKGAKDGAIDLHTVDLFDNPWFPYANIWQLFVGDQALTATELEQKILSAPTHEERVSAVRATITSPRALREHFGIEVEEGHLMWQEWTGEEIVSDYSNGLWITNKDDKAECLIDFTSTWLDRNWPAAAGWDSIVGMDFNYFGRSVVYKLFGRGRTPEEAIANKESWHVVITKEIDSAGSTISHAEEVKKVSGNCPIYCDPTGARYGHDKRGTGGSSDVKILRDQGYKIKPAVPSGDLEFIASANVMHLLMKQGRFRVHKSCTGLLDALKNDKSGPDRKRKKVYGKNSESDKRSGFTDAARYGIWPVFQWMAKKQQQTMIVESK